MDSCKLCSVATKFWAWNVIKVLLKDLQFRVCCPEIEPHFIIIIKFPRLINCRWKHKLIERVWVRDFVMKSVWVNTNSCDHGNPIWPLHMLPLACSCAVYIESPLACHFVTHRCFWISSFLIILQLEFYVWTLFQSSCSKSLTCLIWNLRLGFSRSYTVLFVVGHL